MKMNTIEQLNTFKVGDKVAIHNVINGEISYYATIESIYTEAYIKDGRALRIATIRDDNGNIHDNSLGSAKKVN